MVVLRSRDHSMPQTDIKKARLNAKKIGVEVQASSRKGKKLDVLDAYSGRKLASIGDLKYKDFLQTGDRDMQRRYKARHERHRHRRGTASFYADKILWS